MRSTRLPEAAIAAQAPTMTTPATPVTQASTRFMLPAGVEDGQPEHVQVPRYE